MTGVGNEDGARGPFFENLPKGLFDFIQTCGSSHKNLKQEVLSLRCLTVASQFTVENTLKILALSKK